MRYLTSFVFLCLSLCVASYAQSSISDLKDVVRNTESAIATGYADVVTLSHTRQNGETETVNYYLVEEKLTKLMVTVERSQGWQTEEYHIKGDQVYHTFFRYVSATNMPNLPVHVKEEEVFYLRRRAVRCLAKTYNLGPDDDLRSVAAATIKWEVPCENVKKVSAQNDLVTFLKVLEAYQARLEN